MKSTRPSYEHLHVQDRRGAPLMKPLRNHLADVFIKNLSDMAGTGTHEDRDIRYSTDIPSLGNVGRSEYDVFMAFV